MLGFRFQAVGYVLSIGGVRTHIHVTLAAIIAGRLCLRSFRDRIWLRLVATLAVGSGVAHRTSSLGPERRSPS
jgi:hypothetical protein